MIFAVWVPDTFLTTVTWKSILISQAITGILALALLAPLATGMFDLSVAQTMGFCAVVCGYLTTQGPQLGLGSAILVTLAVGACIGMFNGCLCGILGLDSFIATLGTTSLLTGLAAVLADGAYFGPFPAEMTELTSGSLLGVPIIAVYTLILGVIVWYALEHTPVGRRAYAVGANPDAARLSGVRIRRFRFWSMVSCSTIAALAGVLLASTLNSVNQSLGPQYLLPAFASAFLGTTQIKPGRFNVWGTLLAIVLLGTGIQGLQLVGADIWITDIFFGAALIFAISTSLIVQRTRGRREAKESAAKAGR
ncbi:ABC transporter permease (plasmid) [Nocardioides sp. R1-1]|uniref:ABC transporter permease n=1 Tax=Nocardioides sp. R1-1 TaxID=3383502 RepID=UPI0038CF5DAA